VRFQEALHLLKADGALCNRHTAL